MSYARKQLARGEEVVYQGGQHWFSVVQRVWWGFLLAIVALAVLMWVTSWTPSVVRDLFQVAAGVGLVIAFAGIGVAVWDWHNTEFLVTTRRIVRAEGILNKKVADSSLEKVNDAHLTQSVFGRILGFGDLDILTAADEMGGIEDFPMLADPVEFKVAMLNQKEIVENPQLAAQAYQRREAPTLRPAEPMPPRAGSDQVSVISEPAAPPAPPVPPAPAPTPQAGPPAASPIEATTATLERLADLRDRGLITAEEYEAKKRELLERI